MRKSLNAYEVRRFLLYLSLLGSFTQVRDTDILKQQQERKPNLSKERNEGAHVVNVTDVNEQVRYHLDVGGGGERGRMELETTMDSVRAILPRTTMMIG